MNDYLFGNKIYKLRMEANLSQSELAEKLNVTNKAVSKWENGKSKPKMDVLRKISAVFQVSIEEIMNVEKKTKHQKINKIVVTGGPCAGKSTALSWIHNAFVQKGYTVLFVPETATELITGGVAPWTCGTNADYQKCQMELQTKKEELFEQAALTMDSEKILIICDRGVLDNKAYMSDLEFSNVLRKIRCNEVELRDNYDAVFHLVTAAKGAEKFYTNANNEARTETIEQAANLDDKLISAWTGHPHLRIIDNSTDFENKMKRLIAEILLFLGEPEPFEIERKFLIEHPNTAELKKLSNCQCVEIIQTYLVSNNDDEIRVRQRGIDGHYTYYQTTKRRISPLKRVEIERRLTQSEYLNLLLEADTSKRQIRKTRYCLTYKNQYFEIDVFPFWDDIAIMEIELSDEEKNIEFPTGIRVIKEVTDDEEYTNYSLAKRL
ncbi:MAG: AAA family ATPase [Candidatus Delongbacteria bacterium]|nr:AAA family ATPase [Candidatus Delongbacteria bacterium]